MCVCVGICACMKLMLACMLNWQCTMSLRSTLACAVSTQLVLSRKDQTTCFRSTSVQHRHIMSSNKSDGLTYTSFRTENERCQNVWWAHQGRGRLSSCPRHANALRSTRTRRVLVAARRKPAPCRRRRGGAPASALASARAMLAAVAPRYLCYTKEQ